MPFGTEKLEWLGYPNVTDTQTDRQTHSMTAKAALAYHRAGGKIGRQNIKSIK